MGIFSRGKAGGKASQEKHTDPVCGMVVVEAEALGPDMVGGEAYWFCSAACQHTFRQRKGLQPKAMP